MKELPKYQQIYNSLKETIITGTSAVGEKLETEKELSRRYSVSRITARKALDLLAADGYVTRTPGKGTFIASRENREPVVKSRKKSLGIILPDLSETFGLDVFRWIERLANEKDITIVTGISDKNIHKERKLINRLYHFGVDGFIIHPVFYENFNEDILKLILERFPIVLIDRYLRDISCTCVLSNNREGARMGMQHLIDLGHRNIGYISRPINSVSSLQERELGIKDVIMEQGLRYSSRWWLTNLDQLDNKQEEKFLEHKEKIAHFLKNNRQLTALFCLEYSPVPIIMTVAEELGIRIPEDLSLICFDSPGHLESHVYRVTHIMQNEEAIARKAIALITAMQNKDEVARTLHMVEVTLSIGKTTVSLQNP